MFVLLLVNTLSVLDLEPIQIPEGLSNVESCSICKTVISGITNIMHNTQVQTAIAQLAIELCQKFSNAAAQNLCKTIISGYLPKVISYISNGISKANICNKIGLCKSISNDDEVQIVEILQGLSKKVQCEICKTAVKGVEDAMSHFSMQYYVKNIAKSQCTDLDSEFKINYCNYFINEEVGQIMNWLDITSKPSEVCARFGL
ncbi:prosaposin-like isoform X2 [Histomonas meleagridis]|uniref:prosaposin-like isoform X2 n=1 Tax=Histomonas meleagridis TaxID=135588 RepID=UPI0035594C99|nr:prosaposin-like isoform X2 [Histomonas meleagridis]KAH0802517.1 prosaposin-like isoform X2 [Histomonas meleagridis]